ncbi:zinc finger BED domain-containing protein DAYSLEEPER-like [Papaver somniferum]|uniref:zinc finger BED domain-containing protein DAYSLEEPER-like n=1 Tax=Papaver somniferum TaxID=3469 RepID=UPI000E705888|nr:zinc finger BED domain-containing protein DAYSLEEPER-like [Papaver somniferum]
MSGLQNDDDITSEEDIAIVDSMNDCMTVNSKAVSKKRKRNLISDVWADFKLVEQADGSEKAVCNDCGQKYVYDSQKGGNSTMSRHKCARRETKDVGQLLLSGKNGQVSTRARKIGQMKFRELISKLIIARNLPLSLVEWEEFRDICTYLNDDVKTLSRNTGKADILKAHTIRKEDMCKILKCVPGRISLTSDMWTSVTTTGYISLTVHYVDQDWKLQKMLLNFSPLPPPHSGEALSAKLFAMLEYWGIEEKVYNNK